MSKRMRKKHNGRESTSGLRSMLFLAAGGLIIALVLIGLGIVPNPFSRASGSQGPLAPDFSVPTLDGNTFTLSAQQGKPVVIFAMAYWCGTCVPEARALARLHREYGDRLVILALDVDPNSTPERLQQFRTYAGNPTYFWGFDRGGQVTQAYHIRSLDTTIIVDAQGRIVYRDEYPTPYEKLKKALEKLPNL